MLKQSRSCLVSVLAAKLNIGLKVEILNFFLKT